MALHPRDGEGRRREVTKPLTTLPCTAQELENALHSVCDHGLWDGRIKVYLVNGDNGAETRICLEIEERKEKTNEKTPDMVS